MNPIKKFILLACLGGAAVLFFLLSGQDFLTLEKIKENREGLKAFVDGNYFLSVFLFIALHLATAFFVPGEILLVLAGGFLFGVVWGTLYVDAGLTLGGALAFLSARYLFGNWVQEKYGEPLRTFNREMARRGYSYLLMLRIFPVVPFFLVNYLAGLTNISSRVFILTTSLGVLPGAFFLTYAGRQLGVINRVEDLFPLKFYLALSLLAFFALLPALLSHLGGVRKRVPQKSLRDRKKD